MMPCESLSNLASNNKMPTFVHATPDPFGLLHLAYARDELESFQPQPGTQNNQLLHHPISTCAGPCPDQERMPGHVLSTRLTREINLQSRRIAQERLGASKSFKMSISSVLAGLEHPHLSYRIIVSRYGLSRATPIKQLSPATWIPSVSTLARCNQFRPDSSPSHFGPPVARKIADFALLPLDRDNAVIRERL